MPIDRLTDSLIASTPSVDWQQIDRLLLASPNSLELAQFNGQIASLQQHLPAVQIGLLSAEASTWMISSLEAAADTTTYQDESALIAKLIELQFDAAIIFTGKFQSPYTVAYLLYLAGVPVRIGQSLEFGGGLLSHSTSPNS